MNTREVLYKLKHHLESSMVATEKIKENAIKCGNYQRAMELDNQNIGRLYALSLIQEELEAPLFSDEGPTSTYYNGNVQK